MALTVGTDTYISLADAETYITKNYVTTSKEAAVWTSLSNENKEVLLRQSCMKIDYQRLVGIKAKVTQTLMFPRSIFSPSARTYIEQPTVPARIVSAQVEETLALAKGIPKRLELQRQGVKSYRLGDLSEEYQGISAGSNTLISTTAKQLLRPYLSGGVPIC